MKVPFNDLSHRLQNNAPALRAAFERVLASNWLVLGKEVARFEEGFAQWLGVPHCVSVANGTDALEIALRGLGIKPTEKVATVANAGGYTTIATLAAGATPLFMDVDETHLLATLGGVEKAVHEGASVVVVTHLYGQVCPEIEAIAAFCRSKAVPLIEDCAQSHGAKLGLRHAGSFGTCATFSFYPTKNLGALGDGGALVTHDPKLKGRFSALRQYGWSQRYSSTIEGGRNSRLDEMQAAFLNHFISTLDQENAERANIAKVYRDNIRQGHLKCVGSAAAPSANHLFVVRTALRHQLAQVLDAAGVGYAIHYPTPDYRQKMFADRFSAINLPNTEKACAEVLSLPCYPGMSAEHVARVVDVVNGWQN